METEVHGRKPKKTPEGNPNRSPPTSCYCAPLASRPHPTAILLGCAPMRVRNQLEMHSGCRIGAPAGTKRVRVGPGDVSSK